MTVAELIVELAKLSQDAKILIEDSDYYETDLEGLVVEAGKVVLMAHAVYGETPGWIALGVDHESR